ncbi:selenium-binding family protein [Actibacterium sp. 188UL27-1]|uniref:selenium-binding family protein n=1 Tax=Actibacterium sp. 188UL27-1 TaxID=2786961 RepID=UPI00195DFFD4|nr:selenium-binding family protein [Actibacterium sp. 188UL27-1]MBM7067658.1 selenium-binding family protein [Actibacterium sp. 188UL27-1]
MLDECCGPGYASPADAMKAPRETLLYTVALYVGTGVEKPDYLATVDVDPESPTYSSVIARTEMPQIGDELHHSGWNACSSCHDDSSMARKYLLLPGVRTSNINVVDVSDATVPKLHMVVSGDEIKAKTGLSGPHTVHCLKSDIIISMLGDADGNAPGGFLHLDKEFNIVGRWENDITGMNYNYDFWYQPRHNMMVSSEWGAPNTFMPGFDLEDVGKGKYGQSVHFWDFEAKKIVKSIDMGAEGMIPLEVRGMHDPTSNEGFFAATLSSNVFRWWKDGDDFQIEKVIDIPTVDVEGFPVPMPSLITDILISMDDKYLYFANWLHGDLRQYDIADKANPKMTGQVWIGGLLGKALEVNGVTVQGAPQMIQLSLDGKRLYVTTSLFSSWDNQFYPGMKDKGAQMYIVDCDTAQGGMAINPDFVVDFGREPNGPSRCHEMRYPGGDVTSDIWM